MKSEWVPHGAIDRGRVAEKILDDLRDRILAGKLARGDKLPTEKELAQGYGVSGATVREAIRALATMHLIEVRHGSGAYVTADSEQMVAQSLGSMIRLERLGVEDVLGVLAALNAHAAELAAAKATREDIDALEAALDTLDHSTRAAELEAALRAFLYGLAEASHNPLLVTICKFLAGLQIDMARRISHGSARTWRDTTALLKADRRNVVAAIRKGDAAAASAAAQRYHHHAIRIISAVGN